MAALAGRTDHRAASGRRGRRTVRSQRPGDRRDVNEGRSGMSWTITAAGGAATSCAPMSRGRMIQAMVRAAAEDVRWFARALQQRRHLSRRRRWRARRPGRGARDEINLKGSGSAARLASRRCRRWWFDRQRRILRRRHGAATHRSHRSKGGVLSMARDRRRAARQTANSLCQVRSDTPLEGCSRPAPARRMVHIPMGRLPLGGTAAAALFLVGRVLVHDHGEPRRRRRHHVTPE